MTRLATAVALSCALSCTGDTQEITGALRLPTGAALSPDHGWLFVANSDLDRKAGTSTLISLDLETLDNALSVPAPAGAEFSADSQCHDSAVHEGVVECDVGFFVDDSATVKLPAGAGNIVIDRPFGNEGISRLLIPSSIDGKITWIDAQINTGADSQNSIKLNCNQDLNGHCDALHTLTHRFNDPSSTRLPVDTARISLSRGDYRYAYLPHLTGSVMTLIDLSGANGPEISDIEGDFFNTDPYAETEYAGGFAAAERPCDPDNPPALSLDCSRPVLVASHRFWPGVRRFTVATGTDVILGNNNRGYTDSNPATVNDRPYMADLAFEDESGERLLLISTTPPTLLRLDTRLNEEGLLRLDAIDTVSLCRNPNILAIDRPPTGEALAYISCYSDDQIAIVDLSSFRLIKTIDVGEGPNELVIDDQRRRLYVIETLAHSIALIDLNTSSTRYLEVIARVGVGARFF
ncbi:MAG TPA: hypothetical protein ENK31_06920 [Nannocystis exedens]|nr:hypothetical protein [Nannocystis exedens]